MDMDNIVDTHAKYAHNGKVMLGSAILLFLILFVIIIIHNCRCRYRNHRQNRHISPNPSAGSKTKGLDPSFFKFLPTFNFSAHRSPPECAVCLSEFEENDEGRVLPNCNHGFHTHCIDTWFLSHSNCPICRAPVQPLKIPPPQTEFGGCSYLPPPIGCPRKALDNVELLSVMVESSREEVVAGDSRRFKSSDEEILRMKTVWR